MVPYRVIAKGPWTPQELEARVVASTLRAAPELEAAVDAAWRAALAEPGRTLFDGPMMRLESLEASEGRLRWSLSETSYRPFYVLHMLRPDLLEAHPEAAPRPVGVSAGVITADGKLLLGKRSSRVAYYPGHVHPFAGTLEPADGGSPFVAARRELKEELGIGDGDLAEMKLLAIVEDERLAQPEAILAVGTTLTSEQVRLQLDREEHSEVVEVDLRAPTVPERITPVGQATIDLLTQADRK